jgi:multiple sugar transport system substrate-binding protein
MGILMSPNPVGPLLKATFRLLSTSALAVACLGEPAWAQQKTITVATHYTDEQMRPLTACFRRYEAENPNIKIVHQQATFRDFLQTILTSRIGGRSPDIYNVYSIWGVQLVSNGVLAEPPADIVDFVRREYEARTVDAATVDGKIWGVPAEVSTYLLVYNKNLLREAGYSAPPRTWDELAAIAAKISKADAQGKLTVAGYAFGPTPANAVHPFRTLLFSRGRSLFTDDLRSTNLATPEAVEIVSKQAEIFRKNVTNSSIQVRDFPSGSVGMMITANWFKDTLRQGLGDKFESTVGVAPIPGGDDWRTYQYSFYYGVDARSPSKPEAWRLVRWLNTPSEPGKRSCVGDMLMTMGGLTANKADIAASQAEVNDPFTRPYMEAISSGRAISEKNVPQASEIEVTIRGAIEEAWLGRQDPQKALSAANAQIESILKEAR